jgi:hypothetical protein
MALESDDAMLIQFSVHILHVIKAFGQSTSLRNYAEYTNCQVVLSIPTQIPLSFLSIQASFSNFFPFCLGFNTSCYYTTRWKPRLSSIILALHIHSWVLFHLSFAVCVLIYSPAFLIVKWEKRKFFGGLDPLFDNASVSRCLIPSLRLSRRALTHVYHKVTSHEFRNTVFCLFATAADFEKPWA